MPSTFFSHQAAVLPLKIARPRWFCGTALAIGSMAPDFDFARTGHSSWSIGHTVIGQFYLCLPVTLVLTYLMTRIVARPLAPHLPQGGVFHLKDYRSLDQSSRRRGYWWLAIPSALVGSFSHIGWDSFTHSLGWSANHLGYAHTALTLGGHQILLVKLFQHGSTIVGGLLALWMLRYIGERRLLLRWAGLPIPGPPEPTAPPNSGASSGLAAYGSTRALWLPALVCAILGMAGSVLLAHQAHPNFPPHQVGAVALPILFRTGFSAFFGLCLGCLNASQRLVGKTSRFS